MSRKKNIIIVSMIAAVLVLVVGFAAFQTRLTITGTSNITSTWKVEITSVDCSATGTAHHIEEPIYAATNATFNVGLRKPGDKMTCAVKVTNTGTVDAIIDEVKAETSGSYAIVYNISGVESDTRLAKSASLTFNVIVEFDSAATSIPSDNTKEINIDIIAIQDDGQTLTPSAPEIGGQVENALARKVLLNNPAQADTSIDFSKSSTYIAGYKETHATTLTSSISFSSSSTYYYGSSYTFDSAKGLYSIAGTTTSGTWSSMSTNYKTYRYTCRATSSTGTCSTLYRMEGYTSSTYGSGYAYSRTAVYASNNGQGLYYTSTNTEDNKVTYYFRGDVENNYVKFGTYKTPVVYGYYEYSDYHGVFSSISECESDSMYNQNCEVVYEVGDDIIWRIVRINEDGSVRLVTEEAIASPYYNDNSYGNAYVGYMYGDYNATTYALTHTNTNPSRIKTTLDTWYTNNLSSYSSLFVDAGFCNDRSKASTAYTWHSDDTALGHGTNTTYYGGYNRLNNTKKPQFACPQSNDLFTLTTSTKGNKTLSSPIGLLSLDEVWYAGGSGAINHEYYLNNGTYWWMMTPQYVNYGTTMNFVINDSGAATSDITNGNYNANGARPVVNLRSNVEISGGNGSSGSPYVIATS